MVVKLMLNLQNHEMKQELQKDAKEVVVALEEEEVVDEVEVEVEVEEVLIITMHHLQHKAATTTIIPILDPKVGVEDLDHEDLDLVVHLILTMLLNQMLLEVTIPIVLLAILIIITDAVDPHDHQETSLTELLPQQLFLLRTYHLLLMMLVFLDSSKI